MGLVSGHFSTKQMMVLIRSLAEAHAGGLPILRCFNMLSEAGHRKNVRRVARAIVDDLGRGSTLDEALRPHELRFSRFFTASVVAGERSGRLDRVFPELAAEYETRLHALRKIIHYALYPILVVIVAAHVIPYFRGLALEFWGPHSKNESIEMYTLRFAWAQRGHALFFLAAAGLYAAASRANLLRFAAPGLIPVWPLGSVLRDYALARFFRNMAHLSASGLPMQDALRHAAATTTHPIIENKVRRAALYVSEGATLHEALKETRAVPRDIRDWVQVGEESGNLVSTCSEIASHLSDRAGSPIRVFVSMLEALLVAAILYHIILQAVIVIRGVLGLVGL